MTNPYASGYGDVAGQRRPHAVPDGPHEPEFQLGGPGPGGYFNGWRDLPRPPLPGPLIGVIGILAGIALCTALYAVIGRESLQGGSGIGVFAFLFWCGGPALVFVAWLIGYPSKTCRIALTCVAVLFSCLLFPMLFNIPLLIQLWRPQVTQYFEDFADYRNDKRLEHRSLTT